MSRFRKSASKSQSRSRSRSRSQSTSRSRSSSRSRSRKRCYSSRSRSRTRSHSPPQNRGKKYPRGYQNNREIRGYHRGLRRPYNFRGRGRGYFQRGRYQRGGGGYNNNNNFRPNWKNYKQNPQKKQQQQQYQQYQQQNYSQGRSHNFRRGSRSPQRGHSHHSDRSSPLSRHSHHSSSSSHASSPKVRQNLLPTNEISKDVKDEHLATEVGQKGEGDNREAEELMGDSAGDAKDGSNGKPEDKWQSLKDCNNSPIKTSALTGTTVVDGQNSQPVKQFNPSPKTTSDTNSGVPSREASCSSRSPKKPSYEGLSSVLSSFDFFSKEEYLDEDKTAISIAFGKFLEERNKKAKAWENSKNRETNEVDTEQEKSNAKPSTITSDSVSRKYKDTDCNVSMNSFLKASFLCANGKEEEMMMVKPRSKSNEKDWHNEDEFNKPKSKVTHSAHELFKERFGKWQNVAYSQVANSELDSMAEDLYLNRKQDKLERFKEASSDMSGTARKNATSPSILSPTPLPQRWNSDREMVMIRKDDSPFTFSRKQEAKINVRMDFLRNSLLGSSDILAEERQLSQDLVQSSKRDQEFRSIFQHMQNAQLQRSPAELFAQHIVTVLHHIKAQHSPSCGMTLNERFTMYQRRAAEKEIMKPRKSPEIHRRIDVSPRAFKKHSQLFEAMKSSEDGTYKDGGEKMKGDPLDLRLDIERRKKYCTPERHYRDQQKDMGDSHDSDTERSVEKFSKCNERSKRSKKRSHSSSSSSSSSPDSDPKEESFNSAKIGQTEPPGSGEKGKPSGGFQVRICGGAWNRGRKCSQVNNISSMAVNPNTEEWDPEYTPKSRKYYLHDDREGEQDVKCMENPSRGRGSLLRGKARFIIRKAIGGPNTHNPKWAHDKFRINGGQGVQQDEERKQDHKPEGEINGEHT